MTSAMEIAGGCWAWLGCADCTFTCEVDPVKMRKHTMVDHWRGPTAAELVPHIPPPRPTPASAQEQLEVHMIVAGRRVVDSEGRVWCCVFGEHYGLTRIDGVWWFARRASARSKALGVGWWPMKPMREISNSSTLAALDRWELANTPTDTDPTPVHGIPRPMRQLITTAGAR